MSLADYQTLVDKMVRAPGGTETIADADRDLAIELARLRYSSDAERELVEDVTWDATGYLGPLPTGWASGSYIRSGEFPIAGQPARPLDLTIYATPTEQKLMAAESLPAGAVVRVTFAAPHLLQAGLTPADTIPAAHREAVASYAAHLLCRQLATLFSGERETPTNADRSDTESRARNYAFRAKEYRGAYYAGIGKADPQADGGAGAAGAGEASASVSAWAGRSRNSLTRGTVL